MKKSILPLAFLLLSSGVSQAQVIDKFIPATPIDISRIENEKPQNGNEWREYLKRSDNQRTRDETAFKRQIQNGQSKLLPLSQLSPAITTKDIETLSILSFQMPSGGWYKALPRNIIRKDGYAYSPEGSYEATIDNDATYNELKFLSLALENTPQQYHAAIIKALDDGANFLINSQYPNGGWPQMYPLRGWYHDAVTLNDDAMLNTIKVLEDIAAGKDGFAQIPAQTRTNAKIAHQKALAILLKLQVSVDGKKTIWAQQYDMLNLEPCSARNFEMIALSSGESSNILLYLMKIPNPSPEIKTAIKSGIEYLEAQKIENKKWEKNPNSGIKELMDAPNAKPLLARYYDIKTNHPLFGDRDKTIHFDVSEISVERRNGYAWYNTSLMGVLKAYNAWKKENNS